MSKLAMSLPLLVVFKYVATKPSVINAATTINMRDPGCISPDQALAYGPFLKRGLLNHRSRTNMVK